MKHPRLSFFQLALLASAAWTAVLAVSLLRQRPGGFSAYDETALLEDEFRQFSLRPRNHLGPPVSPEPHALALEADRLLLGGELRAAYESYRAALDARPADLYSRFLAGCLALELNLGAAARELGGGALERAPAVKSTHLLDRLVREREERPGTPWSLLYVSTLMHLAQDPGIALLPDSDPLHELIEQRLLVPDSPARMPVADPVLRWSLALQDAPGDLATARQVLQGAAPLPLRLQALTALNASLDRSDLRLMAEVLQGLRLDEPENAYYELLLATVVAPGFLHLRFEGTPDPAELNAEAVEALVRTYEKDVVDTHAAEVFQFTVEARRAAGQAFPELHVPPPSATVFLGDPYLSRRLLQRALEWSGAEDTMEWQLLAAAGLRVLRAYPETETSLLPHVPAPHLELAQEVLTGLADRGPTAALRREVHGFRPLSLAPPSLEQLRRYVLLPLPIPRLVQDFLLRYGARPLELAGDARRALRES